MDAINTIKAVKKERVAESGPSSLARRALFFCLSTWEIYPIILLAAFLRFYQLPLTEFDADQAILFGQPREAFLHGLIPATGTVSSIKLVNPPGYFYLVLPLAAFTSNPLVDAFFTALLNVLAVLLTYFFMRRYYGRLAGAIAALLYATTMQDVFFSRFIWQPNLLSFFTVLFMLALFRGAVERRPGWLLAALPLLGLMLQLHTVAIYMTIPLVLTLLLAYKTVRWRDVLIGGFLFAVMFSTYGIWLVNTRFADLQLLLNTSSKNAHFDMQWLVQYLNFLVPYIPTPASSQSLLPHVIPLLRWEKLVMYAVTLGAFLLAGLGLLGWRHVQLMRHSRFPEDAVPANVANSPWLRARRWWGILAASPQRRGLLLLLAWQLPPLLLLSHHAVALQPQYFLIFLPGPFILIGLFFSQIVTWCSISKDLSASLSTLLRTATIAIPILLVLAQCAGSCAWLLDEVHGYHNNGNGYNSWQDINGAVNTADQLAQSRHLHHVYIIAGSDLTYFSLRYLSAQMKTPVTLLSDPYSTWKYLQGQIYAPASSTAHCLLLPSPTQGPAVMLLEPGDALDIALLTHFTTATLVSEPHRLGGQPFQIYIVQPLPAAPDSQASFVNNLALSTNQPGTFVESKVHLLETRWTNLQTFPAKYDTTYNYHFVARAAGNDTNNPDRIVDCNVSSLAPGEDLLVPFYLPPGNAVQPPSLSISGSARVTSHITLHYGPVSFQSMLDQRSTLAPFRSTSGGDSIVLQNE